jgi:protein TonB
MSGAAPPGLLLRRVDGHDPNDAMTDHLRLSTALGLSALLHVTLLVALRAMPVPSMPPPAAKPVVVIPIGLVSLPGGGGGGPTPGPPAPGPEIAAAAPTPPPAAVDPPKPAPKPAPAKKAPAPKPAVVATRDVPPTPAEPPAAAVPADGTGRAEPNGAAQAALGSGTGAGGAPGPGTGDGTGGDGGGGARPAYATNPKPPYPMVAKRLGIEGVVTLEVLVRPDGSPAEVKVRASSGHDVLDESALTTVRERWRFIPARRDGQPVEDRVVFPVRFRLREG